MKRIIIFSLMIVFNSFGQQEILDEYIKFGLKHNLVLKQKHFSLEQSIADLKQAKGMFFPSIGINARYSRAGGGRIIDIPIGDLVNPIHQGLNFLNPSFNYPTNIPNGITRFLREEEHETKLSLVQPLIQPALFYNYSIKDNMVDIQRADKRIYVRHLIAEIKSAYINFLKTIRVKTVYETTLDLVLENLRVTRSLYENDKATIDIVYKAEAEVSEIEKKQLEAENNHDLAASYFNHILNKPLDSRIEIDSVIIEQIEIPSLKEMEKLALENREELKQLRYVLEISKSSEGLAKSNYLPGLSLAADYGFQGEKYRFSKDDDFWMASVVLSWNLFNGFQDQSKVEKAEIETKSINNKIIETEDLIRLQTQETVKNFFLAHQTIDAASAKLKGYRNAFRIVNKKFVEGMASQLEYLDVRNKFTQAQIEKIISEYELQLANAELEKVTASLDLNKFFEEDEQ